MIMDNRGQLVWFHPLKLTKGVTDFRTQRYHGKPVLTWWRGRLSDVGVGNGWYVLYDSSYRPIAEVRPGHGLVGDVHEFRLTSHGTALMTIYHRKQVDLRSIGGPQAGLIWDGIVQEVDIPTGHVLFEWHSYPQVGIKESYSNPPKKQLGTKPFPYDYIHLNAIDEEPNGNLLVSGTRTRCTRQAERPERSSGGSAARRARSGSARASSSRGSTTCGASRMGRSRCSTTVRPRPCTSSRACS